MRKLLCMVAMLCAMVACKDESKDKRNEIEQQFKECYGRMYEAVAEDDFESFKEANDEVRKMMSGMSEGEKSTARKAIDSWKSENSDIVERYSAEYEAMRERYNE